MFLWTTICLVFLAPQVLICYQALGFAIFCVKVSFLEQPIHYCKSNICDIGHNLPFLFVSSNFYEIQQRRPQIQSYIYKKKIFQFVTLDVSMPKDRIAFLEQNLVYFC